MKFIVDTSVAVKWVIPDSGKRIEDGTDRALALLKHELTAPDCLIGEFANALFKKVRRKEIGAQQAESAFSILPEAIGFVPSAGLVGAALHLALDIVHPVHDCIFLVAAVQQGVPLVTADRKFHANCVATGRPYPILLLEDV